MLTGLNFHIIKLFMLWFVQDIEFMEKKIEDCEKVLKRSNAKEAKLELECCQKVSIYFSSIHFNCTFIFLFLIYICHL